MPSSSPAAVARDRENRRRWVAIRNMSRYWFVRIILGQGWAAARAAADQQSMAEARAIQRLNKWRHYQRLKAQGLIGSEIRAHMGALPVEVVRARNRAHAKRRARQWGGTPHFGNEAFNRWVLATK